MISGGNVTIYVGDMDRALEFYTQTLGLTLQHRAGDGFAMIDAGGGLLLGLHGTHPDSPTPGARGSISVGFSVTEPLEQVYDRLQSGGVAFDGPIRGENARLAFFGDPDGNALYLFELPQRH